MCVITRTLHTMINKEIKRYLVGKLSPYYSPEEISDNYPIKAHNVRYYANVMGVPTHAQYKKEQRREREKAFENHLQARRAEATIEVRNELGY